MVTVMYSYKNGSSKAYAAPKWLTGTLHILWFAVVLIDLYYLYMVVTRGLDWLVIH